MDSLFSLSGRTAIVTGGARGLGRMIAEGLVVAGARVFVTSRDPDLCCAAATEIGAEPLVGDAGSPEGIAAIGATFRATGAATLDILVNNAGRTWGAPLETFPDKAWPGVFAVNVQAPFRMVQEFLVELSAAGRAERPSRIINIGSAVGVAYTDLPAYSYIASKAAIHQLSRKLASDLLPRNITVNAIQPGYFATSMTAFLTEDPQSHLEEQIPMRRLGRPSEIAGAVIFLASDAGSYLTGVELPVDGGLVGCR
ncbi:NAD(P)-dependent dehydrogenase (short-subunit alcohol dehydrogenase family) [Sphingobium xenophagum]|uniref:NAD(P)-dependent dehydrogenase (Short-subunit alcohol dehydrogenase family) n=1 Tax=Sphingobium xenophagum TaxID=121428 RepID=A0ABU1X2E1_SPHXE|nr:SDR family oxidoreductase [Sphingobium xenophagum]MDR7155733.1 NAD(P)-dependent dehydrogenase (short-subunit alcohol dehydrogenase family) [Sphingobium xenophagum]